MQHNGIYPLEQKAVREKDVAVGDWPYCWMDGRKVGKDSHLDGQREKSTRQDWRQVGAMSLAPTAVDSQKQSDENIVLGLIPAVETATEILWLIFTRFQIRK